jgi:ABC-type glycerol-3-phosphate transport system substrate-binding protein
VELEKMLEDPDELPLYLNNLYSGENVSMTILLGDSLTSIANQQMWLNGFYVTSNTQDFEDPNATIFERVGASVSSFFNSFSDEQFIIENSQDSVDVWVNRPITYVDIMQKMVDSTFTPETGIKVNISVMPDPNKLILANSAGNTPDVALGLMSFMPFDLAIRGAVYDLTEFDDYWEFADNFAPGALVPYILEDGVYAMPETLEFHALVYRKDVFQALDLDVPDTWDDVVGILPTLQRYDMNFYYPTSGGTSLKWFYQTSPLIYQNGGSMYSDDGLTTTIDSEESVAGLQLLGDLYTTYSLPAQVPVFYNSFRYNKLPVGIIDFNTYMQLKNAAPELVGQWELAPYPGIEDPETGEIQRWYVGNGTGGVMFNTADDKEAAWEFMKWWMSLETQTEFAYTLQSTYGPEFLWLSGNIHAVEQSPIDNADKQIILAQIEWLRDVPRTPGQYMLERGLSDIWNTVTFDDRPVRVAIDRQVIIIDREIRRKMIEFGYLDTEGNVIKDYVIRDVDWIQEQIDNAQGGDAS